MSSDESGPTDNQKRKKDILRVRHWVLGVLFVGGLGVYIPMLIGVAQGLYHDEVRDPYTGRSIQQTEADYNCVERAKYLMREAGKLDDYNADWGKQYREWNVRCKKSHPALYEVLHSTRTDL